MLYIEPFFIDWPVMFACLLGVRYAFMKPRYILGEEKAEVIQERLVR